MKKIICGLILLAFVVNAGLTLDNNDRITDIPKNYNGRYVNPLLLRDTVSGEYSVPNVTNGAIHITGTVTQSGTSNVITTPLENVSKTHGGRIKYVTSTGIITNMNYDVKYWSIAVGGGDATITAPLLFDGTMLLNSDVSSFNGECTPIISSPTITVVSLTSGATIFAGVTGPQ